MKEYADAVENMKGLNPALAKQVVVQWISELDHLSARLHETYGIKNVNDERKRSFCPDPLADFIISLTARIYGIISRPKKTLHWLLTSNFKWAFGSLILIVSSCLVINHRYYSNKGLLGEYFTGQAFDHLSFHRRDQRIKFRWHGVGPFKDRHNDFFSVRWTGHLAVDQEGDYEFSTWSDDGVRLRIDDKTIIDNWTEHNPVIDQSAIHLEKRMHKLELEYFQGAGLALVELYWKRPGDEKRKIIGPPYLLPPGW